MVLAFKSAAASPYWPHTLGKIVEQTTDDQGDWKTIYEYSVKNRLFKSRSISAGLISRGKESNEKYKVNDIVKVYYDPSKPRESCLEPGVNSGHVKALIPIFTGMVPFIFMYFVARGYASKISK